MKQTQPVSTKDYLDPNFKLPLDKEGGVYIEPEQHYVMKTKQSQTGEKFFINVVTHPIVDEPEEKDFVEFEVLSKSEMFNENRIRQDLEFQ